MEKMEKIEDFIYQLSRSGVNLKLIDGKLNVLANEAVPSQTIGMIKERKPEIMEFLGQRQRTQLAPSIPQVPQQAAYPLSSSQKRLWILNKFEGAEAAYNMPEVNLLEGPLDKIALAKAMEFLIRRHETLRTVFLEGEDGQPCQKILSYEECGFQFEEIDLRGVPNAEAACEAIIAQKVREGFDLSKGPLLRSTLIDLPDSKIYWVLLLHHIISDGWSMEVMRKELSALYNAWVQRQEIDTNPRKVQYKDYAAWHNARLQAEAIEADRLYWLNQFSGPLPVLELPSDLPRPKVMTYKGAGVNGKLEAETVAELSRFSQQQGGTLFMALLACINALFYRYTGQQDIVIGSPISGREHPDLEDQIGFFLGALPLRTQFSGHETYEALFSRVKDVTLGAYAHQAFPYDELVNALQLPRDASRNPLFDVWVDLHSGIETNYAFEGIQQRFLPASSTIVSKFDLTFLFEETADGINVCLDYNPDVFGDAQMQAMVAHFLQLTRSVAQNPKQKLWEIDILSDADRRLQLETLNNTQAPYPAQKTVVTLFEEQVALYPQHPAVVCDGKKLSYSELNKLANQLADYLKKNHRIASDALIAIKLERNEWMLVAILGVLKSGAAYLPIDTEAPQDRVEYMLRDSGCILLLDSEEMDLFKMQRSQYSRENIEVPLMPQNLMYCIYTSGSTGEPKGVLVAHEGVVNLVTDAKTSIESVQPDDRVLQTVTFSFDASINDWSKTLCNGGTLYVLPHALIGEDLVAYIRQNEITQAVFPAGMMRLLSPDSMPSLRKVTSMGDACPKEIMDKWAARTTIINGYGPTEATIVTSLSKYEHGQNARNIGRPIQNKKLYILDEHRQLLPFGCAGELYIGGVGIARGYLNRRELTAERFLPNPYPSEAERSNGQNLRLYRTGDRVRYLANGDLEFLGRVDDQVKIRGYRIELGEIESHLAQHPAVASAVVMAQNLNGSEKELVAYTTGSAEAAHLRSFLKDKLPTYMVPVYYVRLDQIPLTANGKVDRKALPLPVGMGGFSAEYTAPDSDAEWAMAKIWSEVLGIPEAEISMTANFFDLGGHSIKAIKLIGLVQKELGIKLALKDLFANGTVRAIVQNQQGGPSATVDANCIAFNLAHEQRFVFYLPPIVGLPVGLDGLLSHLAHHDTWGFCYSAEGDYVQRCTETIAKLAGNAAELSLIGYSAGGNIAFEVTKSLEQKGINVKQLVVVDSYFRDEAALVMQPEEMEAEVQYWLKESPLTRRFFDDPDSYIPTVVAYTEYINQLHQQGQVQAPIFNFVSEEGASQIQHEKWAAASRTSYTILQGVGGHVDLFFPENIVANTEKLQALFA
jgi:amino acid adenylation domain-containing protein